MRIELNDYQHQRVIDTDSAQMAATWLAAWLPFAISDNASFPPWQLRVWPTTPDEIVTIRSLTTRLDQHGLLEIAQVFLDASQQLAERQSAARDT